MIFGPNLYSLFIGLSACVCGGLVIPDVALLPALGLAKGNGQSSGIELAQNTLAETVLFFETESAAVRVLRRGSNLFMNLYNKSTGVVEANNLPAEIASNEQGQTIYRNTQGEVKRFASISLRGETNLEIVAADGEVILQEPGYNTVVGVPDEDTNFRGNSFPIGNAAIVISSRYANLRSHPALDSEVLGNAPRREIVEVIDRVGNLNDGFLWYQVTYNGVTGWVRGDLLQPI